MQRQAVFEVMLNLSIHKAIYLISGLAIEYACYYARNTYTRFDRTLFRSFTGYQSAHAIYGADS